MSGGSYCVICRTPTAAVKLCAAHKSSPPSEQLRVQLVRYRESGMAFEEAWDAAMLRIAWPHDTAHRREWKAILRQKRQVRAWRAAYNREPPTRRAESAPAVLIAA